jgi:hypothetical protein
MSEYVEPDFLPYLERVETPDGVRWFGLLVTRGDLKEVWRSPPFVEEADAQRAARDEFFNNTDR